jgi:hypothetical protein
MTISHKFPIVKRKVLPAFLSRNSKGPGGYRGLRSFAEWFFGYSLKELGSDRFLGDLRLR